VALPLGFKMIGLQSSQLLIVSAQQVVQVRPESGEIADTFAGTGCEADSQGQMVLHNAIASFRYWNGMI
jgi:hypothetical protein